MRTTITLDAEAEQAVDRLRRATGLGLSAAVNQLVHQGAAQTAGGRVDYSYPDLMFELGAKLPLDRTGELLDLLDEDDRR